MKELLEKFDSKTIAIGIIYVLFAVFTVCMIPEFLSFAPQGMAGQDSLATGFWQKNSGGLFGKMLQLVLSIVFIVIPFIVLKDKGVGKENKKYGDQGTAKIGTVAELNGLLCPANPKAGEGGYTLSKNIRLSASKSYEHVAVIGPTGSGKSTSFFIPCLLDADGTHSFVVTDPKGELCRKTGPYLRSKGMRVVKICPLEPENNKYFYNPLLVAEDNTQVRELAQLILINGAKAVELQSGSSGGGQSEWINMSIPLFHAALTYFKDYGKKKTINEAIDFILREDKLDKMEETFKKSKQALDNFRIFKTSAGSEKTLSSIKSVLTSNVQLFLDEKIQSFTKTPFIQDMVNGGIKVDESRLFNPRMLREKPTALFVCVPETKSDYMSPLMSVFYSQMLNSHMQYFDKEKYPTPILYMLDEFANIGVLPGIAKIAATCRSRKIGLSIGIQGVEQLKRNYGEENANDILNNLKSKLVFSGLTGDSAQYISDLCGVTTIETTNYSKNQGGGQDFITNIIGTTSSSKNGVRRELFTKDEIRRMDENDVLVIAHNRNVVRDKKNTYYTSQKYNKRVCED